MPVKSIEVPEVEVTGVPSVIPPDGKDDAQVVPLLVSTLPEVLGATNSGVEVPLPRITLLAVSVAAPVPPLATGRVPVTPVVSGRPVALVSTPEVGVPSRGVTSVGLVESTVLPVPVEVVTPVPPLTTGRAVPERVIAKVPVVVIGLPATLKKVGTVAATLVTVPLVAEVGVAFVTAAPAPAPSVTTMTLVPVATVTVAPDP